MGELKHVRCIVPSAKGIIDVEIRREETEEADGRFQMDITVPESTTAEVYLPVPESSVGRFSNGSKQGLLRKSTAFGKTLKI